ncbi:3-hydroxybutyryl-CoA dehydrogenase [Cryptococcus deuterogattii 99/473]|uniref:3-hydroxybutyryl-CoA dehydrogenase n=1 Tax=Cryptococcus deuterogattii Ram5 TaxID=1296110 RepID=A0A0D0U1R8_9TREE|nr:3-hydroxybutyryl-CoA dehydrogenase [Cryptococcus deuterogattii LA55]KIR42118.1 3-hydroxybutyryl-CoA dehydrogenase [Cryptococcus deuterogattii Ram5]KIR73057.1 3-hydroxybutyryl-CoA dehydrogenase [Cryptococcus deuterogattii CA1014]KIR90166.1 3-hydroxybutyryl-CoA dehydrogenase [Cryptococcus deuterogattii CBS 10090]KIY56013.1 3-hydroxybutyryl-CoA dehydrogenase [Cryptococcus deuterogattii 99/473]
MRVDKTTKKVHETSIIDYEIGRACTDRTKKGSSRNLPTAWGYGQISMIASTKMTKRGNKRKEERYVTAVHARVPLTLHDPSSAVLSHAMSRVQSLLSKDVSKNRMTREEADEALARISPVKGDGSGLNGDEKLKDVDIVIEAIPEIPELKLGLFKRLGDLLSPTSILGSNTSSISLTKLAASAGSMGGAQGKSSAERVIGIHYFNPVPVMKLVEIIPALQTSKQTIDQATAFGRACKKEVTLSADSPGFIANAILMPMLNEAIMVLEKGIASTEHIDTTFRLGMGHPMGPLALADLIGLDTFSRDRKDFIDNPHSPWQVQQGPSTGVQLFYRYYSR